MRLIHEANHDLTYDDVFMIPSRSGVMSRMDVDLSTSDNSGATIPLVVANMTAVSGRRMAETVARRGGLTVIPQDIPIPVVADVISWMKQRHLLFDTPITLEAHNTVADAASLIHKRAHGAIIVVQDGKPIGIVTEADWEGADRFTQVQRVMSKDLMVLPDTVDARAAFDLLHEKNRKLAPVVDKSGKLVGILTRTSALRSTLYQPALDTAGKLRIAAAVGVNGDVKAKVEGLIAAGVDLLVIDTAHGHQEKMIEVLKLIRSASP
ncbi:MAG: CBS domain-containing protein, partial [Actinobacteria bacterium]|nr:CBS domain-containing protein [Actinomycetota bacterium]